MPIPTFNGKTLVSSLNEFKRNGSSNSQVINIKNLGDDDSLPKMAPRARKSTRKVSDIQYTDEEV